MESCNVVAGDCFVYKLYDASLKLRFDAGALKPIHLADGGELSIE